jgi:hypothetical protein
MLSDGDRARLQTARAILSEIFETAVIICTKRLEDKSYPLVYCEVGNPFAIEGLVNAYMCESSYEDEEDEEEEDA